MTVVNTHTRLVWRNRSGLGTSIGPYVDEVHKPSKFAGEPNWYAVEYVAEPASFQQIEAHTELGGYAVAFREGVVYAVFTEQDGPGFAELWPDVSYHLVVSIEEVEDGSEGQTDRT